MNTSTIQNHDLEQRLTLKQIKQLAHCSHSYIYNQIKEGKLAAPEKMGRSSRWRKSDVKAWLDSFARGSA